MNNQLGAGYNNQLGGAVNQLSTGQSQAMAQQFITPPAHPKSSALLGIRERIAMIEAHVRELHGIADRVFGLSAETASKTAPQAVPNGILDDIESALNNLSGLSNDVLARFSRIA